MKGNYLHGAPVALCLVLLVLLLGITSCAQPNSSPLSGAALLEFQSHFMNSYNANSSTTVTAPSRATVPVGPAVSTTFPTGQFFSDLIANSSTTNTIHNYPASGEETSFAVSTTVSDVYRIVATTVFPSNDARSTYVETYYVQDQTPGDPLNPDSKWTYDDPVGSLSGSTFTPNTAARVSMTLTFANTDTRSEVIENNTTLYSFPDINGSLALKAISQPVVDTTGLVTFSSVVGYVTKPTSLVQSPYWQSTSTPPNVVGLRYYSEKAGGVWSSVSFERITAEDQDLSTLSFADLQSIIFTNKKNSNAFTTLGTSVLRENATAKVMQTLLVNNVQNLTYQLQLDSTGTIIYVLTADGQLIQAGL